MGSKNPFQPGGGGWANQAPENSPFKEPEAERITDDTPEPDETIEPREIESVPSSMWTIAGYLILLTLLVLTGYSLIEQKRANDLLLNEIAQRDRKISTKEKATLDAEMALSKAKDSIKELRAEADELKRAKDEAAAAQSDIEAHMRDALASKDITISELQGKLTLNILDRVLFDSGQAVIKAEGQEVLRKVAAVLGQYPDRQIQVSGHTDNVPIHTAPFPSNWELSSARALAAVRFLVDEAGVNPSRLAAVANGEFQPVADNSTVEGRAKNRRIAIVVLPEVFNQPLTGVTNAPATNTPPVVEPSSPEIPDGPGS
ncbi:OmpA family protein [bacterium]|nr:OmpA family protein [bacterium]